MISSSGEPDSGDWSIRCLDVYKRLGGVAVLNGLNVSFPDNTITVVLGPSGTGKSLLALQFLAKAVREGGRAALFVFEEELQLLFDRVKPLGFDLAAMHAAGKLHVAQIDAAEISPEMSAIVAGPPPLKGTCSMSMPARALSISMTR